MTAEPHHGIPVLGCNCLGCDAVRELHEQARAELDLEKRELEEARQDILTDRHYGGVS